MINKVIPGVEAPSMKEITKTLYNGLLKKGKLNFRSDFDLGKEILKQGASLKMQGLEFLTDKVIEHEEISHEKNLIRMLVLTINKLKQWVYIVYQVF